MQITNLEIDGAWTYQPTKHEDNRGMFFEWFQGSQFSDETGHGFELAQANCSISKKGVIRGIHLALLPPGQAKFVTCFSGKVLDLLIDLRKKSKTFLRWQFVTLDSNYPTSIYLPAGLGHAFMALEDNSTFVYLCDQKYNPKNEITINPFDSKIAINWPNDVKHYLSERDLNAPGLEEVIEMLPD